MAEIESRAVELTYDGSKFDSCIEKSESKLEKFKKALNFKGKDDDLSKMKKSVDKVADSTSKLSKSFDLVNTSIRRVVEKITDDLYSAIQNTCNSLSIDQISGGWSKYEEMAMSVSTIMNATGDSLAAVTKRMNKLLWFTDETSYDMSDMANNIGKFTSANAGIDDATDAMMGIALWASSAGQGVNEASRAMYNISQAYSAGVMRLEDWKSIENANMATVEFKQTALDTAVALGKLKKTEDGYYQTASKHKFNATEGFTSYLTSDRWMDTEVMMETLKKYGEWASKVYDKVQTDGVSTTEAMDSLAESTMSIGEKAMRAGQEYKTFTDVLNATKDAVSSGWYRTFDIIFGNMEEAKKLWTELGSLFYDIFASKGDKRNDILSTWKESGGRADLINALETVANTIQKIKEIADETFSEFFPPITAIQIRKVTYNISEFLRKMVLSDQASANLRKTFTKIASTTKAVTDILKAIGETIITIARSSLPHIFDAVGNILTSIRKPIADIFKSLKNTGVITNIGNALSSILNTMAPILAHILTLINKFINGPAKTITKFLADIAQKIKDLGLGEKAINILSGAVNGVKSLAEGFKALKKQSNFKIPDISSSLDKLRSYKGFVGSDVFNGIIDILASLPSGMPKATSNIQNWLDGRIKAFNDFLERLHADGVTLSSVIKDIVIIFTAKDFLKVIKSFKKSFDSAIQITQSFNKFLDNIGGAVKTLSVAIRDKMNAEAYVEYAKAVLILAGAISLLAIMPTNEVITASVAISAVILSTSILYKVMSKCDPTTFFAVASLMLSIAAAITAISFSVLTIIGLKVAFPKKMKAIAKEISAFVNDFANYIPIIVASMLALTLGVGIMTKSIAPNLMAIMAKFSIGILAFSGAIMSLGYSLIILSAVVSIYTKNGQITSLAIAFGGLLVLMLALSATFLMCRSLSKNIAKAAVMLLAFTASITALIGSIVGLALIFKLFVSLNLIEPLILALGTVGLIMMTMVLACGILMSESKNLTHMKNAVTILWAVVGSVTVLLGVITAMSLLFQPLVQSETGLLAIASAIGVMIVILVSLVAAIGTLKAFNLTKDDMLSISITFGAVALSLTAIAGALMMLSSIPWQTLLISTGVMLGSLAAIVASMIILKKMNLQSTAMVFAGAIALIAASVLMMASAMLVFSKIPTDKLLVSMALLVGALALTMLMIVGLSSLMSLVPGISLTMLALVGAVAILSAAVLALSTAMYILGVVNWKNVATGIATVGVAIATLMSILGAVDVTVNATKVADVMWKIAKAMGIATLAIVALMAILYIVERYVPGFIDGICKTAEDKIPKLCATINKVTPTLIATIQSIGDQIIECIAEWVEKAVKELAIAVKDLIYDFGKWLGAAFAGNLDENGNIPELVNSYLTPDNLPEIQNAYSEAVKGACEAATKGLEEGSDEYEEAWNNAFTSFPSLDEWAEQYGEDAVNGVTDGVESGTKNFTDFIEDSGDEAGKAWANSYTASAENGLEKETKNSYLGGIWDPETNTVREPTIEESDGSVEAWWEGMAREAKSKSEEAAGSVEMSSDVLDKIKKKAEELGIPVEKVTSALKGWGLDLETAGENMDFLDNLLQFGSWGDITGDPSDSYSSNGSPNTIFGEVSEDMDEVDKSTKRATKSLFGFQKELEKVNTNLSEVHKSFDEIYSSKNFDASDWNTLLEAADEYGMRMEEDVVTDQDTYEDRLQGIIDSFKEGQITKDEALQQIQSLAGEANETNIKTRDDTLKAINDVNEQEIKDIRDATNDYADKQAKMWEDLSVDLSEVDKDGNMKFNASNAATLKAFVKRGDAIVDGINEVDHKYAMGEYSSYDDYLTARKKWTDKLETLSDDMINDFRKRRSTLTDEETSYYLESIQNTRDYNDNINSLIESSNDDRTSAAEEGGEKIIDVAKGTYNAVQDLDQAEIDSITSMTQDAMDEYFDSLDEIISKIDEYSSKLKGKLTDVFSIETDDTTGKKKVNRNKSYLHEKIAEAQKYYDALKELKSRGVSQSIISSLANYDAEDGLLMAEEWLKYTPEEINNLNSNYENLGKLSDSISELIYEDDITKLGNDTMKTLKDKFEESGIDFSSVGEGIVDGIFEGIWLAQPNEKMQNFAQSLLTSAKDALGIHSPSKRFAEMGEYCSEGFDEGSKNLGNSYITTIMDVINRIKSILMSDSLNDITSQPVISPILDLDSARTSLGSFDKDVAIQTSTTTDLTQTTKATFDADNANVSSKIESALFKMESNIIKNMNDNAYNHSRWFNAVNENIKSINMSGMEVNIDGKRLIGYVGPAVDSYIGAGSLRKR